MNHQLSFPVDTAENSEADPRVKMIAAWMHDVSGPEWRWFIKVLRGNDTLLTNAHQAGPYVPRRILFELFPSLGTAAEEIGERAVQMVLDSHGGEREIKARWYPSKKEAHLTGWGGRASPLLDPDATGSVVVMAFHQDEGRDADSCRVWLCSSPGEEDEVSGRVGPIEPGVILLFDPVRGPTAGSITGDCQLTETDVRAEWLIEFPSPAELLEQSIQRVRLPAGCGPDERLMGRRKCEFELFRSVERVSVMPRVARGFATVEDFVDYANSVTNRRKSRSGSSLGWHTSRIFDEEGLSHSYDKVSEGRKRPDFLFPSAEAYRAAPIGSALRMLAVKTTCKDRWRQVLNEADKIERKHLLTLQEGVSLTQHDEMEKAGVILVVPRKLHGAYHESIRPKLLSLSDFIEQTRALFSN